MRVCKRILSVFIKLVCLNVFVCMLRALLFCYLMKSSVNGSLLPLRPSAARCASASGLYLSARSGVSEAFVFDIYSTGDALDREPNTRFPLSKNLKKKIFKMLSVIP